MGFSSLFKDSVQIIASYMAKTVDNESKKPDSFSFQANAYRTEDTRLKRTCPPFAVHLATLFTDHVNRSITVEIYRYNI